jgi:hypothetical protein
VKRFSRAVDPVPKPAEALEPAESALDHVALALECGVFGIQLTNGLHDQADGVWRDAQQNRRQVDIGSGKNPSVPLSQVPRTKVTARGTAA